MKKFREFLYSFDEKYLGEMANVRPITTGLPMTIYISNKNEVHHGPRIKVCKIYGNRVTTDMFSVTIADIPEVVGKNGEIKNEDVYKVVEFVKKNKELFLKYWYLEIGIGEVITGLQKV